MCSMRQKFETVCRYQQSIGRQITQIVVEFKFLGASGFGKQYALWRRLAASSQKKCYIWISAITILRQHPKSCASEF